MTSSTKPFTTITSIGKGVSNFGTGLAITGAAVDTYQFANGNLSGGRYAFHLTGTGASILTASYIGGPYGAAVGLIFYGAEKAWDMTQPLRNEIAQQYWNFVNALESGWRPR